MELLSCSYDNEGRGSNDGCQRAGNEEGIMDNTPRNSFSFQSAQILKIFFLRNEQRWHFYPLGLEVGRCTISKINNSWLIWCRCQPQLSKQGQRGCQQFATDLHSAFWQNSWNEDCLFIESFVILSAVEIFALKNAHYYASSLSICKEPSSVYKHMLNIFEHLLGTTCYIEWIKGGWNPNSG